MAETAGAPESFGHSWVSPDTHAIALPLDLLLPLHVAVGCVAARATPRMAGKGAMANGLDPIPKHPPYRTPRLG